MHDLEPITALGGSEPRVDRVAGRTLCEVPDLALASVAARRGHEAACAARLAEILGAPVPGPGRSVNAAPFAGFWTGPDQWMITAAHDTHEGLADEVKSILGDNASVTEQNDAWVTFDLTGDDIRPVLELLCNIDLARFETGAATRATIHHLGCFVLCIETATHCRFHGARASARSLHHALVTAMAAA